MSQGFHAVRLFLGAAALTACVLLAIGPTVVMTWAVSDLGVVVVAMAWVCTALLLFSMIKYFIKFKRLGWKALTWAVVLGVVFAAISHPFVYGVPGRVGETILGTTLKVGMSRGEVVELGRYTGASTWREIDSVTPNSIKFSYVEYATLCAGGGSEFDVHFDNQQRVTSWHVEPWGDSC